MHVLVTGGAGYIGSHACKALAQAGFIPVAFDNLSTGWGQAVKFGPLHQGDLMDRTSLDAAFARYNPVAVMHFAALSLVGESMTNPGKYWRTNVNGSLNLIEASLSAGCRNLVFSSTCATYGDQDGVTLDEDSIQTPINAYCGTEGDLTYVGGSLIADPYGEPLVQAGQGPSLLMADLPANLDAARLSTQSTDYRRI